MRQLLARSVNTYWLPRGAIEPSRIAVLPVRSQTPRASSGREPRIGAVAHQPERVGNTLVRDEAEVRRLPELNRQPLAQRLVEYGVAGRVSEIGEHHRIFCAENGPAMREQAP